MRESMTVDPDYQRAVYGVCQGFPGAVEVLHGLKSTFEDEEFERMMRFLFEHGPRGPRLWERYRDRCGEDSLMLGRDLLAQASEYEGWPDG